MVRKIVQFLIELVIRTCEMFYEEFCFLLCAVLASDKRFSFGKHEKLGSAKKKKCMKH